MKALKLSFINKIELSILGFNPKKISRWLKNKNVLNSKKEKLVEEEWQKIGKEIRSIKINNKNAILAKKKLDRIGKRLRKLKREKNKGSIIFYSFWKFAVFSVWFGITFLGSFELKNIKHEREHAKVYLEEGIGVEYGWQKVFSKERKIYRFHPFIIARAPMKIHLKSIKSARKLSYFDTLQLKLFNKYK